MKYNHKRLFFNNPVRSVVQILSAISFLVLVISIWGFAGAHNLCPWAIIEVPTLMLRLGSGLFFLWGILIGLAGLVSTFVYPRIFCGWVCPLGTMFDFLGNLGAKLHINAKRIPHRLNEKMRIFSYGVLIIIVLATAIKGSLVCQTACPAFWICAVWKISIPVGTAIILLLWLALSLRVKRGFCRYVCPYGALLGTFAPISHYAIVRNLEVCNNCNLCTFACPMGIDLTQTLVVKSAHCIGCGDCVKSCPRNALEWASRKSSADLKLNN